MHRISNRITSHRIISYRIITLAVALLALAAAKAQDVHIPVHIDTGQEEKVTKYAPMDKPWAVTVQYAQTFAFGDDSWNVYDDYSYAHGEGVSVSLARQINRLFSARLKGRWLKLRNRVNLEVYDAYVEQYPGFFPDKGFYSYNSLAAQAEVMFNLTNLLKRNNYLFNVYVIGGAGVNTMFGYDEMVDNWDGSYGFTYHVDTRPHTMPLGCLGGMIDLRLNEELSFNAELLATFTGDLMEGVKYEENYDVYITASVGFTLHF